MKSALPKIAAIVFAVASVTMMGTSMSAYFNRLDYVSHMSDPVISDYKFTSASSDGKTAWTVQPSVGDDRKERKEETGYAALQEAYKHKATRLNSLASEMNQLEKRLIDQQAVVSSDQAEDRAALATRKQQLQRVVTDGETQYLSMSQQQQSLMVKSEELRQETADRREDVTRLKSELEELRTDRYRLQELRRELTDRLLRLQLENQAIHQRLQQVSKQTQ